MLEVFWIILEKLFQILRYPRNGVNQEAKSPLVPIETNRAHSLETPQQDDELDQWDGNIDDFEPSPPKPPGFFAKTPGYRNFFPVLSIVSLWLIFSVYQWTSFDWSGDVSQRSLIVDQEYWRVVTALLVHKDVGHLLSNMPLFFVFGFYLRGFFGVFVFPVAAFAAGMISNCLTVMFYPPNVRLLGASGMLYSMVAMWIVFYMAFELGLKWKIRLLRAIGVSLLLLFPTTFQPEVSYLAHGFGFFTGLSVGMLLLPKIRRKLNYRMSSVLNI